MPQNPGTACWDLQTLLQVTAPSYGAEPKVRALSSHILQGLVMAFPARSSRGWMTLEEHSHWDAALNTPSSGVKILWHAQGVEKPGRTDRGSARVKQSRGPQARSACQDTARDQGVLQQPDPD